MLNNQTPSMPVLIEDLGTKVYGTQGHKTRYWVVECPICKKHYETRADEVKNGRSTKCRSCATTLCKTIHGLKNHRLYSIHRNMINRCYNNKNKHYKDYGGRGIAVCDRWKDINNFIEDMYPSFEEGLTIDRINNDGNYEPNNCRWADLCIQASNIRISRKNNTSGHKGVVWHKATQKWCAQIQVNKKMIHLGLFKTSIDAANKYDLFIIENNLPHTINIK